MTSRIVQLKNFFQQYADRFNAALQKDELNVEETANAFADHFIEASPAGIVCGANDARFRTVIPQGYAFYKSIGVNSMTILSSTITELDGYHSMTKVAWRCEFTRKDHTSGHITFDVIYFTWSKADTHKIFAYITGDEQKALKANGLIP